MLNRLLRSQGNPGSLPMLHCGNQSCTFLPPQSDRLNPAIALCSFGCEPVGGNCCRGTDTHLERKAFDESAQRKTWSCVIQRNFLLLSRGLEDADFLPCDDHLRAAGASETVTDSGSCST